MKVSTRNALLIAATLLVVAGAVAYFFIQPASNAPKSQQKTTTSTTPAANTIVFDGNTFNPETLTVKSGTSITIKNTSSVDVQFDSDPHPVHSDDTDLNVGNIAPGESTTFTVTKVGSFSYHDHLDPGVQGKIVVE